MVRFKMLHGKLLQRLGVSPRTLRDIGTSSGVLALYLEHQDAGDDTIGLILLQIIPAIGSRLPYNENRCRVLGLGIVDFSHGNLVAVDGELQFHGNLVAQRSLKTVYAQHVSMGRRCQQQGSQKGYQLIHGLSEIGLLLVVQL